MIRHEHAETREFLEWVADRLVYVYKEDPQLNYIDKLRDLARAWDSLIQENKELNALVDSYQHSNSDLGTVLSELANICKRQAG